MLHRRSAGHNHVLVVVVTAVDDAAELAAVDVSATDAASVEAAALETPPSVELANVAAELCASPTLLVRRVLLFFSMSKEVTTRMTTQRSRRERSWKRPPMKELGGTVSLCVSNDLGEVTRASQKSSPVATWMSSRGGSCVSVVAA